MLQPYVHSHHGERDIHEFARPITLGRDLIACSSRSRYWHQCKHVCSLVSLRFGSWLLPYAFLRNICSSYKWGAWSASTRGSSPIVNSCHQQYLLILCCILVAKYRPTYWRGWHGNADFRSQQENCWQEGGLGYSKLASHTGQSSGLLYFFGIKLAIVSRQHVLSSQLTFTSTAVQSCVFGQFQQVWCK